MRRGAVLCLAAFLAVLPLCGEAASLLRKEGPSDATAPVLFSADEVQYDETLGLVVARGNVEISQRDNILLADVVTYNQRTDTITASGHVSLLQPTGDIIFGDFVELHDELRDGFIKDIRLLMADRSRLAANTGRRIDGKRTELRRGVYSPCDLCRDNPTAPPLWQIEAEEIIHDADEKTVEYHDAVMELDGIPVFWSPYFSHPDPSVKRQSGFLAPVFGYSNLLGAHTTVPYYWVISPDKDATFKPIFTTMAGEVLGGEYRQRFGDGRIYLDGSINPNGINPNSTTVPATGPTAVRGHLFGTGEIDLNEDWRTGFDIQRASDPTYLLLFHYPSPATFLVSHGYGEAFGERSYANISSYAFQSLRPGVGDSGEPIVAPVADYDWSGQPDIFGGRPNFQADGLNLLRLQGTDTRRLSVGGGWNKQFDGLIGDQFLLYTHWRNDGYYTNNLPLNPTNTGAEQATITSNGTIIPSTATDGSALAGRTYPQLALTWRYPWVRRGEGSSQVIEPIVAGIVGPNGGNPATIPNEDSQGFEFDETSLFVPDRFPGLDRVDTGQRVDYGLRSGYYDDSGGSARFLIGQSYRFEETSAFLPGSGLENRLSDIVGGTVIAPNSYLNLLYRFRLAATNLTLRRQEVAVATGPQNLRLSVSYVSVSAIPNVPDLQAVSEVSTTLDVGLTRYWSTELSALREFTGGGETLNSRLSLTYRDECIAFIGSISQSGIRNGNIQPGTSLLFTIVFKNLGEIGARAASF